MALINETIIRTGTEEVAGVNLNYTITKKSGESVSSVQVYIVKNNKMVGNIRIEPEGKLYISFQKDGVTDTSEQLEIISRSLDSAETFFNETVE